MKMRLDKFLSNNGFGTRKEVKDLIKKGYVSVNDNDKIKFDQSIDPTVDIIKVDDEIIEYKENYYFLMNKPKGYISATEDYKQDTVLDLIPEYAYLHLFPVGRLDKDTTGALILTTDGELTHRLISPKYHVDKIYYVEVDKILDPSIKDKFEHGLKLDGEELLPSKFEYLDEHHARVTLHQGKYHQVKRMFEYFGYTVINLHRETFAFLTLKGIEEGDYRELTDEEVSKLKEY